MLSLVVALLMSMTLLGTGSVTLARTQLAMAHLNQQTSNTYYLARSGAEKAVDTLNKEIENQLPKLMEEAASMSRDKILSKGDFIYALDQGENPYKGKYRGRDFSYHMILSQLIDDYINNTLMIKVNKEALMDYQIDLNLKGYIPIHVTTKMYTQPSSSHQLAAGDLAIEVTAQAKEGPKKSLAKSKVIAIASLNSFTQVNEEILEAYTWASDDITVQSYLEDLDPLIFQDVLDHQWSYNNPIYIASQGETIDISRFQERPTAIIGTDPEATITLTGHGIFKGVIVTPGSIDLANDLLIKGMVIAAHPWPGEMEVDLDMLFKIHCIDLSLQRRLYDYVQITNYKEASGSRDILEGPRLVTMSPLWVMWTRDEGFQYTIKSLKKSIE